MPYNAPRNKYPSVRQLVYVAMKTHSDLRETANEERLIKYVQVSQTNAGKPIPNKPSSIGRTARLLRKKHPELRGKDYNENVKHNAYKVAQQIRDDSFGRKNPYRNLEDFQTIGESV